MVSLPPLTEKRLSDCRSMMFRKPNQIPQMIPSDRFLERRSANEIEQGGGKKRTARHHKKDFFHASDRMIGFVPTLSDHQEMKSYRTTTASISTSPPMGSCFTATQERAGGFWLNTLA